jgi:hypothetical protein
MSWGFHGLDWPCVGLEIGVFGHGLGWPRSGMAKSWTDHGFGLPWAGMALDLVGSSIV